MVFVKSISES